MQLLDLLESAARSGASTVSLSISEQPGEDLLAIEIQDDGWGPDPETHPGAAAINDWAGSRSLVFLDCCEAAIRDAGGSFSVRRSLLGGLWLSLQLPLSGLERDPLDDLASLLASVVCTHQGLELVCRVRLGADERCLHVSDLLAELPDAERGGLEVARTVSECLAARLVGPNTSAN